MFQNFEYIFLIKLFSLADFLNLILRDFEKWRNEHIFIMKTENC
jgi:hypothetical protein